MNGKELHRITNLRQRADVSTEVDHHGEPEISPIARRTTSNTEEARWTNMKDIVEAGILPSDSNSVSG